MTAALPPALAAGTQVSVLGVHRRSLDLLVGGDVYSVVPVATGNLPRGVLVDLPGGFDWREQRLRPGEAVTFHGEGLSLSSGVRLNLADAATWAPRRVLGAVRPDGGAIASAARHAASALAGSEGLAVLAGCLESLVKGEVAACADDSPLVAVALEPLRAVLLASLSGSPDALLEGARRLVGLGIGLTPSGDDLLVGYLGSLVLLAPYLRDARWLAPVTAALAIEVDARTTPLAATYLRCAFAGEIMERHEQVLAALALGDSDGGLAACRALRQIGHSSGAEIALGSLLAVAVAAQQLS